MHDWLSHAPDAARAYLDGRTPEEIECIVSDLPGIARGKAMPASKFARQSRFFLPRTIFHQTITGGWVGGTYQNMLMNIQASQSMSVLVVAEGRKSMQVQEDMSVPQRRHQQHWGIGEREVPGIRPFSRGNGVHLLH